MEKQRSEESGRRSQEVRRSEKRKTRNTSLYMPFESPAPAVVLETATKPACLAHFRKVQNTLHLPDKRTSERPKVVRIWCTVYFANFDIKMCFTPQRRALFQHLDFQECSDIVVPCPFWLGDVLRALFQQLNFQKWSKHVVFCPF